MECTFTIIHENHPISITRQQLPLTSAHSFADYRLQDQTINNAIIDIATPPTTGLTAFNVYVALSRARGRDGVRTEDERLAMMDRETEQWWKGML
ncbi:hypothetical protein DEU56DRAFT_740598 [Suillus clintonianus]|uniref:uncharacterized protein n=1 Tax=Suillus clintonianus TaxID=1904413 RepID=UPI001B867395|nr:uncharacterized protein DEU56DRAFT_740598 [Suillus clintonianus]KAG2130705.1 hypothetical protein DEU56DRAFT_740598 [Suillus clintonianus]